MPLPTNMVPSLLFVRLSEDLWNLFADKIPENDLEVVLKPKQLHIVDRSPKESRELKVVLHEATVEVQFWKPAGEKKTETHKLTLTPRPDTSSAGHVLWESNAFQDCASKEMQYDLSPTDFVCDLLKLGLEDHA